MKNSISISLFFSFLLVKIFSADPLQPKQLKFVAYYHPENNKLYLSYKDLLHLGHPNIGSRTNRPLQASTPEQAPTPNFSLQPVTSPQQSNPVILVSQQEANQSPQQAVVSPVQPIVSSPPQIQLTSPIQQNTPVQLATPQLQQQPLPIATIQPQPVPVASIQQPLPIATIQPQPLPIPSAPKTPSIFPEQSATVPQIPNIVNVNLNKRPAQPEHTEIEAFPNKNEGSTIVDWTQNGSKQQCRLYTRKVKVKKNGQDGFFLELMQEVCCKRKSDVIFNPSTVHNPV